MSKCPMPKEDKEPHVTSLMGATDLQVCDLKDEQANMLFANVCSLPQHIIE